MAEQVKAAGRAEQMRERAAKFIDDNPRIWDTVGRMTAFSEAERERALDECAKAACSECKEDFYWSSARQIGEKWFHSCLNLQGKSECKAAAIHELRREKGRG